MITTAAPGAPPKLTRNEGLKEASPTLAGNISATLADTSVDRFSDDDYEFLKFHGIYQQDDRDLRKTAKHYMFMVRGRLPGGVVQPDHYLAFDSLATKYGNQTLRITSRQGFQFHGIVKSGLGPMMKGINEALATTLAACGDVNRNVMASPTPASSPVVAEVQADAHKVSDALLPKTKAYHQIWVEGVALNLENEAKDFVDPLYGKTYLPRKFKTAFVIPPVNDIDVFTNCLGFVAIVENGVLAGYNLLAGGGMGMSHGNVQTYPRLADVVGFVTRDQIVAAAQGVVRVHRDFGDRTNRKHARLKYVLEEKGVDWFRDELEKQIGFKLAPARKFEFTRQGDTFGWHKQLDGNFFVGLHVESGRIKDANGVNLRSALRKIVEQYRVEIRLTPSQNLLIVGVKSSDRDAITKVLGEHGIKVENQSTVIHRASMVCPALPTCGLALAESERIFPDLLGRIESLMTEVGLNGEEIIIRMTGCPNGCARSSMAELGFIGKAPGKYQIYLGGNHTCTRLNTLYKESVKNEDIINELRPVFTRFVKERSGGEHFGDYCERVLLKEIPAPAQN
ncbi:MAG TPA: NADPH-dependent assimilatory sulfite reductase hemoprotein subunit [Verrucomicrobiae bacterium]|jgi:sulfite reductase (NADPH) hemoprotein beta-component|nr:NADPH-dependent assimilatory sulfite reductase hemoprotein subunit [Verrucomicrobiae bacterium]